MLRLGKRARLATANVSLSSKAERIERWARPAANARHARVFDDSEEAPQRRSHRDSPDGATTDSPGRALGRHSRLSSASSEGPPEDPPLDHCRGRRRSDASLSRLLAWEGRRRESMRHGQYGEAATSRPMTWTRVASVDEYEWGGTSAPPHARLRIRKEHGVSENRARAELHLTCGSERCLTASVERLAGPAGGYHQSFVLTRDSTAWPEVVHRRTAFVGDGALDLEELSSSGQVDAARDVMERAALRAGAPSASTLIEALIHIDDQDPLVRTALGTLNELVC